MNCIMHFWNFILLNIVDPSYISRTPSLVCASLTHISLIVNYFASVFQLLLTYHFIVAKHCPAIFETTCRVVRG